MVTNQINKPNLAINRLSVGVEDRKKWASSEKRARAAKERVSEERREEKSAHSIFLSYFLPMLSPLSWSLEQAKPNTDLNSLRMLINHPRAAHAPRFARAWSSAITCLWQEVWLLCKTNVSIVLVPLSFLFSGYDQQKGFTPFSSAIKRKTKTNRALLAQLSLHLNFTLLTYPELQFCC